MLLSRALSSLLCHNFVKQIYSNSFGEGIANICVHCGKVQGNSHVGHELQHLLYWDKEEAEKKLSFEAPLPNKLAVEDLGVQSVEPQPYEERILPGEIHHKDFNWENDDPSNLILLCKDCHVKMGKKTTASRSRKAAREERRIRREKKQADKWRENYYARNPRRSRKKS